jgi:RNA polymerase sigma factor (sigma-70 family)
MNDLIEELKQGLQEAFQTLVARCSQKVIGTCYAMLNNMEDAEDVAQDVFIEVYRSIRRFRNESDLNTWIYRIAINKTLDLLRKRKRRQRFSDLRGFFHEKVRPAGSPHQQLEEKERQEILLQQIGLLAEKQRIALILSQFERLSNKQIADVLGISEKATEALLHRARENLRKNLALYFEKKSGHP